jgi:uncharacterized membrane protein YhaH (DUF805 family)
MNFAEAVQSGLKNYFKIVGRASRREYWYFQLFVLLVGIVASTLDGIIFPLPADASITDTFLKAPISLVFQLGLLIPQITLMGRRFRDVGFSAKWLFLWLVTVVFALLVVFAYGSVDQMGQAGTLEGDLNVLGYLAPALLISAGIQLFFFILTLQPTKSGAQGNKYADDYDPTRDPKSDDFNPEIQDWQPKL